MDYKHQYKYKVNETTGRIELLDLSFPCKYVEIPRNKIYKGVYTYSLIKIDLSRAIYYLERAKVETDFAIREGLFKMAVILYAKCFSRSGKGGRGPLERSIYKGVPGEPEECHNIIIEMRNKYVAHDEGDYKKAKLGAVLNLSTKSLEGVASLEQQSTFSYDDSIDILLQLCTIAHNKADEKFCKAIEKAHKEMTNKSFDELNSYPEMTIQVKAEPFELSKSD